MPDQPVTLRLIQKTGPLATTSANLSGGPNATTASEVLEQLDGKFDLLLDGGQTPTAIPSTVVDCTKTTPVILRQGNITAEMVQQALAKG